jgi:scyllo-inositol 2-dehydrogenase (NADP+)
MKKLNVGIIGQGRSGWDIHADSMGYLPEKFQIVAVSDLIAARCKDAQEKFGAQGYTDYKEMLKRDDLDLVVNATPSHLHTPITLESLDAGHNTLCEKPLARRVSDVDALVAKSKEKGKVFAIFQQARFDSHFRMMREVIASGDIGRVVMIKVMLRGFSRRWDWQTLREFNGGNMLNQGPHYMDQALQLFGLDIMPKVTCTMDNVLTLGDADDHTVILLQAPGKPVVNIEISSCYAFTSDVWEIYGSQGTIKGGEEHLEWRYFKPEEAPEQHLQREPLEGRSYCSEQLKWYEEKWDKADEEAGIGNYNGVRLYGQLYDVLANGAPLEVKPEHVRRQIEIFEECLRQNGR